MPGRQCRTAWSERNKVRRKEKEMSRRLISFFGCAAADLVLFAGVQGVSQNYQTKANKYTIIPAINEINSVIPTKNFAGTSLLLHIYCISSEASIPTIQDRINTTIPDLFVAYAIAKEHNAITATEVIILFFSFMPPLSLVI